MLNIFFTRIKILLNQKIMIFWALLFPILLSLFFGLALTDAYSADPLETISISVVNEGQAIEEFETFTQTLEEIEISEGKKMFKVNISDVDSSEDMLKQGEISGYIVFGESLDLIVRESGINQSVIKSVLESYSRISNIITNIISESGNDITSIDFDIIDSNGSFVTYSDQVSNPPDMILNYYYSLIAMACLFAASYGLKEITSIQANLSFTAARVNLSPVPKYKFVIASLSAAYVMQVIICFIFLAFLKFILGVNFGDRMLLVIVTCLLSCLFGLFLGGFIGAVSKKDLDVKSSIVTAVSLSGCFLAGLMVPNMKIIVANTVPVLKYINPANLIVDALYSLYYYEDLNRYILNITILSLFSFILGIITILLTRRSKYASI